MALRTGEAVDQGESARRPSANERRKLHRFLLVVTGRPAAASDEQSPETTRQLAAIALSWLLVAIIVSVAVVLALHFEPSPAARPQSAEPAASR